MSPLTAFVVCGAAATLASNCAGVMLGSVAVLPWARLVTMPIATAAAASTATSA